MDVPTPAAPKNDEHFSEKSVCQLDFSCPKVSTVHRLLRGIFLPQNSGKKYFVFQKMGLVISLFLRWAKHNPSLLNKDYPFLPMALRNP